MLSSKPVTKRHRKALINMNENLSRVSFKSRNRWYTLLYHAVCYYILESSLGCRENIGQHWKKNSVELYIIQFGALVYLLTQIREPTPRS
jgi:hypothetical protein